MARPLTYALDQVMLRPKRTPHWKVYLYDTRSGGDTIGDIVRGTQLDILTGPIEISASVLSVQVTEKGGDYATSGVASSAITLTIVDDTPGAYPSRWDAQFSVDDLDAPARFLRRGNTIRIVEGDLGVDPAEWPYTFTGKLVGQPGVDRSRVGQTGTSLVTMSAVSREAGFVNKNRTSDHFDRLTSYLVMGQAVAEEDMQLDADEISFASWGGQLTGLKMQFVEQSPLVTIAQLMFPDGFMPRFDGEGKLTQAFADIGSNRRACTRKT